MPEIQLLSATGVEQVDQIARMVVGRMERRFPGRVRGYYLVGSYVVGEAIPTSDIDVVVMFNDGPTDDERQRFAQAREECRRASALPIDLTAGSEAAFMRDGGR